MTAWKRVTALFTLAGLCGLTLRAYPASPDTALQKQYDEQVLTYQRGFLFFPEHVLLNGRVIPVGSGEFNGLLKRYPASNDEIEKYHGANLTGLIMIGIGVLAFGGGLVLPNVWQSDDPFLVLTAGIGLMATGTALGIGGLWLMNSDVKQAHLYRSIWYYNESVLFERPSPDRKTGKSDRVFPLFTCGTRF